MSAVHFNDYANYTNYTNYGTDYDFSSLMGRTANPSGSLISDYASIKSGSYGKLLKAYYAKRDVENASVSGDSRQELTLMRSSADSLKKSADALNDSSLWEKKENNWDSISKTVKSFIDDYNSVVEQAGDSDTKNILRNAVWMTGATDSVERLLSKVGITIGKGNKLKLDEDTLKEANVATLKSLFTGTGSFADRISGKAASLSRVALNAAARVKGTTYTKNGSYSDTLSKLFSSTLDKKIGDDKNTSSNTSLKTASKKEDEEKKSNQSDKVVVRQIICTYFPQIKYTYF